MFSEMKTYGVTIEIGGGQNDAPKLPPFNKEASLVVLEKELWLVVQSPSEDLRSA